MQEIRHDGSEELSSNATMEDFEKALNDPRNASVAMHKPGAKFNSNGVQFRVTQEAKLKPIRKKKRKEQRKARKRNRR